MVPVSIEQPQYLHPLSVPWTFPRTSEYDLACTVYIDRCSDINVFYTVILAKIFKKLVQGSLEVNGGTFNLRSHLGPLGQPDQSKKKAVNENEQPAGQGPRHITIYSDLGPQSLTRVTGLKEGNIAGEV